MTRQFHFSPLEKPPRVSVSQAEYWDETLILSAICLCTSNETTVLKMRFKIYKIDRLPFKNESFSISHCLESSAFIGFTFLSVSAELSSGFLILKIRLTSVLSINTCLLKRSESLEVEYRICRVPLSYFPSFRLY